MQLETVHLKDIYPFLGEQGRDPVLTVYVRDELPFKNYPNIKRPGIVLCPGGGYSSVSPREAEPIALQLLAMGCNVFMLKYSVAPHGFPHQLREVAAVMEQIFGGDEALCALYTVEKTVSYGRTRITILRPAKED